MDKLIPNGDEFIAFEGEIFDIIKKPFLAGKKEIKVEIARRPPGVRLMIIKGNKILMSKEFRAEIGNYDYRLPGGKIFNSIRQYREILEGKKELLPFAIEAAKKECQEETGLVAKKLTLLQLSRAGGLNVEWDLYYFIVEDFEAGEQRLEAGEVIYPEWKTFDEVKELCVNGKMNEDRTVGVLLKFLLKTK
jgi:ADP-ribose pyrophosphatase